MTTTMMMTVIYIFIYDDDDDDFDDCFRRHIPRSRADRTYVREHRGPQRRDEVPVSRRPAEGDGG